LVFVLAATHHSLNSLYLLELATATPMWSIDHLIWIGGCQPTPLQVHMLVLEMSVFSRFWNPKIVMEVGGRQPHLDWRICYLGGHLLALFEVGSVLLG
jgi:hypothetical protein